MAGQATRRDGLRSAPFLTRGRRGYRSRRRGGDECRSVLAGEGRGAWSGSDAEVDGQAGGVVASTGAVGRGPAGGAVAALSTAVDGLLAVDVDGLDDGHVLKVLAAVQVEMDRLHALRSAWARVVESRAARASGGQRRSRAAANARRRIQDELKLTPSETKRMTQTGEDLEGAPTTRRHYEDGRLRPEQAEVIARTLKEVPSERRDEVEAALLAAATTQNAVELGRTARRLLAEIDVEQAQRAERRRHLRRAARMSQTPDGGVAFSGTLYGVAAELAMTAVNAFRLPDAPEGPGRTPEQATADAFEALFGAALDAGRAPAQHGERPHVLVIVDIGVLAAQAGLAELGFTGPITFEQIRPLLADCSMARIVLDADGIPLQAGEKVRTVPAGLWRYLQHRDRGCRFEGCTAPAAWCDVAHGADAYRTDGRLSPTNSVLLCRRHHRQVDLEDWAIRIDGDKVHLEPPERTNAKTRAGP